MLALFAIFGALFIGGAASLLNASREESPEQALLSLFQKLRREAVISGQTIEVTSLENGAAYIWGEDQQLVLPVQPDLSVRLLKAQVDQAVLIGGQLEETPLEHLRFYADGTCDPVRVQIQRGQVRRVAIIDPWTCAPQPDLSDRP